MGIKVDVPCNVGDILYRIFRYDNVVDIDYLIVSQITIKKNNIIEVQTHNGYCEDIYSSCDFGKIVFINEEDAEKRKEEINNKLKGGR